MCWVCDIQVEAVGMWVWGLEEKSGLEKLGVSGIWLTCGITKGTADREEVEIEWAQDAAVWRAEWDDIEQSTRGTCVTVSVPCVSPLRAVFFILFIVSILPVFLYPSRLRRDDLEYSSFFWPFKSDSSAPQKSLLWYKQMLVKIGRKFEITCGDHWPFSSILSLAGPALGLRNSTEMTRRTRLLSSECTQAGREPQSYGATTKYRMK